MDQWRGVATSSTKSWRFTQKKTAALAAVLLPPYFCILLDAAALSLKLF